MLNVLVPMAGAGSRFASAGYLEPKPLILVNGVPMIRLVIENLRPAVSHRFIFICQQSHIDSFDLKHRLSDWAPGCEVIGINGLTEGAACTCLAAVDLINNGDQLMIANSDQYVDVDVNNYLEQMEQHQLDGLIMTMKAEDPKWSFVGLDIYGMVSKVVEKEVISDEATVGIYNFRRGSDFVWAARDMIKRDIRTNNEFYVAPSYNQLIGLGRRIGIYNVGAESNGMHGLGVPADLELFLSMPVHLKAIANLI